MSISRIYSQRTSQPQGAVGINRANLLARGLSVAYSPSVAVDLLGGSVVNTLTRVAGPGGVGFSHGFNENTHAYFREPVSGPLTTVIVGGNLGTPQNPWEDVLHGLGVNGDNGVGPTLRGYLNSALALNTSAAGTVIENPAIALNGVVSTTVNPSPLVITNGGLWTVGWAATNATVINRNALFTTFRVTDQVRFAMGPPGTFYCFLQWNRALSNTDLASVTRNPWQLFAPIERPIWVPVTAAGGGVPTLSSLSAINVTTTTAQLRVTVTV